MHYTEMDIKFMNVLDMLGMTPPETLEEIEYLISVIKSYEKGVS